MKTYKNTDHTFVVCAYRESPYLEECILSLRQQTIKSRICVATATPNRYISELADKYHLPLFVNTGEKGIAGDWNFGCSCADTPLVTLAHQDDVYCPTYAESVLDALNCCGRPLIAFTDYSEIRNGMTVNRSRLLFVKRLLLTPLKVRRLWKSRWVRRRILSLGSAICCPSVTMVKENLDAPIFKNNMKSNIDWQAWEEISRKPGEFAYVAHPVMKHRIHEESTTSELLEVNGRKQEDLYMFRKFWPGWIARGIDWFYRVNEKSNRT